jgi:hypothetical protein
MRAPAQPKIRHYREISIEADAISRRLQAELGCSANELAELAIRSLAKSHARSREQSAGQIR